MRLRHIRKRVSRADAAPAQVQLAKLGAPHDSILVDDLDLLDTRRHKLVIFLNASISPTPSAT